jgi:ferredoxin/DMSO/TMAO reductase YedYZ heme-binding membrane subunit
MSAGAEFAGVVLAGGIDAHDSGVRQVAALTARCAYFFMCLTLCWGVLTATNWVRRVTGHQALRGGHMMLAAFTLSTAGVHVVALMLLDEQAVKGFQAVVPFLNGETRHALGIISFDLMIAITVTAGMHRIFRYRNWLRFHQLAYAAIALALVHSWWGAWVNADIDIWWIGGITAVMPALVLTTLRFAPPGVLIKVGLLDGETPTPRKLDRTAPMQVSVDNQRCHRYGFCQTEAPAVFQLLEDGRLQYKQHPEVGQNEATWSAVRSCPMRAIQLKESVK